MITMSMEVTGDKLAGNIDRQTHFQYNSGKTLVTYLIRGRGFLMFLVRPPKFNSNLTSGFSLCLPSLIACISSMMASRPQSKEQLDSTRMMQSFSVIVTTHIQGMAVSKQRFGRTRISGNFWPCIWFGEPNFVDLLFKRYFFAIVKILFVVL